MRTASQVLRRSILVAALMLSLLGIGQAASGAHQTRSHQSAIAGKHMRRRISRASRRAASRRRWLDSVAARSARIASRKAYENLDESAVSELLRRHYARSLQALAANPAAKLATRGHIIRYLDDHTAIVATPKGRRIEKSTAPLRVRSSSGHKHAVDLALQRHTDDYTAVSPVNPVVISTDSNGGLNLGSRHIGLTLIGASVSGSQISLILDAWIVRRRGFSIDADGLRLQYTLYHRTLRWEEIEGFEWRQWNYSKLMTYLWVKTSKGRVRIPTASYAENTWMGTGAARYLSSPNVWLRSEGRERDALDLLVKALSEHRP